jgi:hypothetical protein
VKAKVFDRWDALSAGKTGGICQGMELVGGGADRQPTTRRDKVACFTQDRHSPQLLCQAHRLRYHADFLFSLLGRY